VTSLVAPLLLALLGTSAAARANGAPGAKENGTGREVVVAAAADLKFAMEPLVSAFRAKRPDVVLKVSYGSSGSFHAQISNGAPFDLFFSADAGYPHQLAKAGLSTDGKVALYAIGHLVVWVPAASPIDVRKLGIRALLHSSVRRIAIANPRHAPYGRAAEAAMKSLGVHEQLKEKLVLGENVAQAAQFVESGSAEIGILALSLALAPALEGKGRRWDVPLDAFPRIEQGCVVLRNGKAAADARAFRDFVTGPEGREILNRFGLSAPD